MEDREIQYEGWVVSGVAQGLKLESITGSWIAVRLVTWERERRCAAGGEA